MQWVDYVVLLNAAAIVIVVGLFVSALRGIRDRVSHHAFLGILVGQVSWSLIDALSAVLAVRYNYFSDLLGTMAGLAVIGIGGSTYVFCEFFGTEDSNRRGRGRRIRLGLALVGSLASAALTFSDQFITARRVTDGVRHGQYGPYFVLVGMFVALLVLTGIALLIARSLRVGDPRTRLQLRMFALAVGLTLVFAFGVTYVLPLLGDFRFDFAGPPSFVIFVSVVLYTILFHEFVDLKRAYVLWGLHMIAGGLCVTLLVFVLWALPGNGHLLSSGLFFSVALVFVVGVAYQRLIVPRLRRLVQGPEPDVVPTLVALFSAIETSAPGKDAYLIEWLEILRSRLQLVDAGLVLYDPRARRTEQIVSANGRRLEGIPRRILWLLQRPLPTALGQALAFVISTEAGRLPALPESFQRRYSRTIRVMNDFLERVAATGYPLLVPLIRDEKLEAFLFLGRKESGRLYYAKDLKLLHALRFPLAAALNKVNEQAILSAGKQQAESIASRLSKFLFDTERVEIDDDHALVFRSGLMEDVVEKTRLFAGQDSPVLILGETGTGKELIARIIHNESPVAAEPFVAINCAAMPQQLWEDELFGHVRGAFTDARESREGKLSEAAGGTIFLDEVGELPMSMQSRLLRVLQERTYSPLGSDKVKTARCRFVFATNRDLVEMIQDKTFREDLYYRINVLEIRLPPLRERLSDVPVIVRHVLEELAGKNEHTARGISAEALQLMVEHGWPGNVRELQNTIVRAATLAAGREIGGDDLAFTPGVGSSGPAKELAVASQPAIDMGSSNYKETVDAFRRSLIIRALHESGGNKTRAAEILRIKRTTLNSHMKELGITF